MKMASYIFVEDLKIQQNVLNCMALYFFEVPELNSNHLEADSRIFSLIFHPVKIKTAHITIISADTDVFILGIYFWNKLTCRGFLWLWLTVHIITN